jgi:hypothetical protein
MTRFEIEVGALRKVFGPVNVLADSCEIIMRSGGLDIPAADRIGVAMASISVSSSSFSTYHSESRRIGLQIGKLLKVLDMSDDTSKISLLMEEDGDGLVKLRVDNKESQLGLISLDSVPKQPGLPEYEFSCEFEIGREYLIDAIETTGVFSDKLIFDIDEGANCVFLRGVSDIDRTSVELENSEISVNRLGSTKNSFDQNYLLDLIKMVPKNTDITIKLGDSVPLRFRYPIFQDGDGSVEVTLAPWKEGSPLE